MNVLAPEKGAVDELLVPSCHTSNSHVSTNSSGWMFLQEHVMYIHAVVDIASWSYS